MNKEWNFLYDVRYEILDPHIIYNFVGRKISDRYQEIINRKKNSFYKKLEESILKDGFFNPICIVAGWSHDVDAKVHQQFIRKQLPTHMKNNDNEILICDRNGGSRLFFAQKYNLKIPCIITDYVNRFSNSKTLYTINEIKNCFTYSPKQIRFDSRGVLILIPHQLG